MKNYLKRTLKNGVKLYLYPDKDLQKFYVDYSVNYGSGGEYSKFYYKNKLVKVLPGVAHFIEHLIGEHSKYGNIYEIFNKRKYQRNGVTYSNLTRYYFCGVKDIKDSIKILINAIDDPVFTKEDIIETRNAIIEETKRTLNNKYAKSPSLCFRNMYKSLDLYDETLSSIGDEHTTKAITYKMLKTCYDAFYYDKNKTLLIAGNFDPDEMTEYVESIYEKLKPHKKNMRPYYYPNKDEVKKTYDELYEKISEDMVTIGFKEHNSLKLTRRELATYIEFIFFTKFYEESYFVDKLKTQNIIAYIDYCSRKFLNKNHYSILITASVKDYDKYLDFLLKEIKTINFKEAEFKLFIKGRIASEAGKIDYKYDAFNSFKVDLPYTEDFSEVEFYKTLTFEKFLEFYNTLLFDNYTIARVRDKNNC